MTLPQKIGCCLLNLFFEGLAILGVIGLMRVAANLPKDWFVYAFPVSLGLGFRLWRLAENLKAQRLLCWWYGHEYDGHQMPDHWWCIRCERHIGYHESCQHSVRWRLHLLKKRFREWLRCPDCGQHFGRHDDTQDHIPF